ncbi:uncharacterized protein LOC119725569 [Patiria miniata]|uniref:Uncharacterized protein n=1 Tax=Patiria miniata TaxID=46514 RepID=A0A913ZMC9_PATMI|nr:uncharacterized protein LOC119725569 [Patiria miniata]
MPRSVVLLALVCSLIGVSSAAMYCFKCTANPYCEPRDPDDPANPIDVSSDNPGVYVGKCSGVCYDRRITHTAYKETLIFRGCYERETDCVPGCFGNEEHQDCVRCCNRNMCNSARAVTFSLPVVLLAWIAARIVSH